MGQIHKHTWLAWEKHLKDLRVEYLNCLVKSPITGLGVNEAEKAISKVGKTLDADANLSATVEKDEKVLMKIIPSIFCKIPGRVHELPQPN